MPFTALFDVAGSLFDAEGWAVVLEHLGPLPAPFPLSLELRRLVSGFVVAV